MIPANPFSSVLNDACSPHQANKIYASPDSQMGQQCKKVTMAKLTKVMQAQILIQLGGV